MTKYLIQIAVEDMASRFVNLGIVNPLTVQRMVEQDMEQLKITGVLKKDEIKIAVQNGILMAMKN